ncbi:hypothetical protein GCM10011413_06310 [Pedobacter psychrotolerans]|uniref:DUF1640 domain-containing protein n=2 Tax=Pedobacter psychrotolerans TaxID=1843235 RepID=A0ABQ1SJG9_9SPHI|nr:hypothetical protein GCM10011413_06310 [Pedobacter psychrotolerans]
MFGIDFVVLYKNKIMSVTEIQLFQILKAKLGEHEAEQLVSFVKAEVKSEFNNKREILATKEDIANMQKTIYFVGLIQFLAIIGSVIGIVNL